MRIFDSGENKPSRFAPPSPTDEPDPVKRAIIDAIKLVYDPEIPVNLYDLGLIYTIDLAPDERSAKIDMTLTSPACPVAQELPEQVKAAAESVPGIERAEVRVVWEPKWTREMMCDEARLELGLM